MMRLLYIIVTMFVAFSPAHADDKLDMEGITIVGNSELPKALYIVPWQERDQQSSAGKPVNSIIEEDIVALDRHVFLLRVEQAKEEAGGK